MEAMSYVFLFAFFVAAAHFHLLVAASLSHFVTAAIKFSCFSFNEIGPLFLISVTHINVDVKIKSKESLCFVVVVVFFSLSLGGHAIYCRNERVLEM